MWRSLECKGEARLRGSEERVWMKGKMTRRKRRLVMKMKKKKSILIERGGEIGRKNKALSLCMKDKGK